MIKVQLNYKKLKNKYKAFTEFLDFLKKKEDVNGYIDVDYIETDETFKLTEYLWDYRIELNCVRRFLS